MASQAQIDANRRNAAKSTGPRTPQGKRISSRNSLVHGLTSGEALLPGESPEDIRDLQAQFMAEWNPLGPTEESLVQRMVSAPWRLRRFSGVEAGIFNLAFETDPLPQKFNRNGRGDPKAWAFYVSTRLGDQFGRLARYENHLQREFLRSLNELKKLQAGRPAEDATGDCIPVIQSERPAASPSNIDLGGPPPSDRVFCETDPISEEEPTSGAPDAPESDSPAPVAAGPAVPHRKIDETNPMEFWGPPLRWTDFAPELRNGRSSEPPETEES